MILKYKNSTRIRQFLILGEGEESPTIMDNKLINEEFLSDDNDEEFHDLVTKSSKRATYEGENQHFRQQGSAFNYVYYLQ